MPKWTAWLVFWWLGTGPRPELNEVFKGNPSAIGWWAIALFNIVTFEKYELPTWRKGWQRLRIKSVITPTRVLADFVCTHCERCPPLVARGGRMAKKKFVKTSGKDWALADSPAEATHFTSAKSGAKAKKRLEPQTKYFFSVERDEASGATVLANALTSPVHDRMPVILRPDSYDLWLDPRMQNLASVCELLKPYDAALMRCYPVSSRINHVANDDEECSRPVEIAENQNRLFV